MSNAVDADNNSKKQDFQEDPYSAPDASKKLKARIQELENERNGLLLTISDLTRNLSLENTLKRADQLDKPQVVIMEVKPFFNTIFRNSNQGKKVKLIINNNVVTSVDPI